MNQQHNKRRRKKKSVNFPAVMFLGLLITCVALASPLLNGKNIHPRGDYTIEEVLVLPQEAGMYVEIVEWQGEGFKAIVTDPGDNGVFPEKAELTILFDEESEIRLDNRDMFKYNADEPNAEAVGWETALFGAVSFAAYLKYVLHPQDVV